MLPNTATIYLAPHCDSESYKADLHFWDDVHDQYKVDMSSMRDYAKKCLTQCPHVSCIDAEDIMAHASKICTLDLEKMDAESLKCVKVRCVFWS